MLSTELLGSAVNGANFLDRIAAPLKYTQVIEIDVSRTNTRVMETMHDAISFNDIAVENQEDLPQRG